MPLIKKKTLSLICIFSWITVEVLSYILPWLCELLMIWYDPKSTKYQMPFICTKFCIHWFILEYSLHSQLSLKNLINNLDTRFKVNLFIILVWIKKCRLFKQQSATLYEFILERKSLLILLFFLLYTRMFQKFNISSWYKISLHDLHDMWFPFMKFTLVA